VTVSQADKAIEYASYAKHCLKVVEKIPDQESRIIHREMAAEWFKLADQAANEDAALKAQAHRTGKRTDHG
jgi:DNA primase